LCIALDANDITQLFCYIIRAIESRVTIWSWLTLLARQIYVESKLFWPPMQQSIISSKELNAAVDYLFAISSDSSALKMLYYDIIIITIYIGAIKKSFI
jgi:hypothetical protein